MSNPMKTCFCLKRIQQFGLTTDQINKRNSFLRHISSKRGVFMKIKKNLVSIAIIYGLDTKFKKFLR